MLLEGQAPTVRITYAMLYVPAPKPLSRKKRWVPDAAEKLAARVIGRSKRRKCTNPYCKKRVGERKVACSVACAETALMHYRALVALLENLTNA